MGIALKFGVYLIPYSILIFSKYDSLKGFAVSILLFGFTYMIESFIFCLCDSSSPKTKITFGILFVQIILILIPCISLLVLGYEDFQFLPFNWLNENKIKAFSFSFILTILTTSPTNNYICSKCLEQSTGGAK